MCDDVAATVKELSQRGAEFTGPIQDQGFGRTVMMRVPATVEIMLYQPNHPVAFSL
jgi:hypothetical protein